MTVTVAIARTRDGVPKTLRAAMDRLRLRVHRIHKDDDNPRQAALLELALPAGADPDQVIAGLIQVREVLWAYHVV